MEVPDVDVSELFKKVSKIDLSYLKWFIKVIY